MDSGTYTSAQTFTVTHARHLAAKVSTDLMRMHRLYDGVPSQAHIADLEAEVTELIRVGYLGSITYGFRRNGEWIEPTLRYTAKELSNSGTDDDPGRVVPGKDVSNAEFYSYLTYSPAWEKLTEAQKSAFKQGLPIQRVGASTPAVAGGCYFVDDKSYSAGGYGLSRSSVRG